MIRERLEDDERRAESRLERLYARFERMGILNVFFIWVGIVVFFGLLYMVVSAFQGSLVYSSSGNVVESFLDSVYFSFITATSTGFGDIVPHGFNKVIGFFEVVIGLTIFALVTSKIVGIKQERILREIYEFSLQEKVNRIRGSLYVYRTDVSKVIDKVETATIRKRELAELWTLANYVEQRFFEIRQLFSQKVRQFTGTIDVVDAKLLSNSMTLSLAKTSELLLALDDHQKEWRKEINLIAFGELCSAAEEVLSLIVRSQTDKALLREDELSLREEIQVIRRLLKSKAS